jgi:hypothetical protein
MTQAGAEKDYHFIEVVWGPDYIDLFLNVSLATQLSSGNLPAFTGGRSRYRIFTRQSEIPRFRAHPMLARLEALMPIDFVAIDAMFTEEIQLWSDWFIRVMSEGHRRAIADAQQTNAALFFLSPDILCGRGSLSAAAALLDGRPGAVMVIAPRLNQNALSAALEARRQPEGVITLEPRELVGLGLQYLHRATSSLFWDDPHFEPNPTILYWRVGPNACIAQGFHLHPLLVAPANWNAVFTDSIDGEYVEHACPDPLSIHVPRDTEAVAIFSTTSEDRTIGGLLPNKARVSRIARFYEAGATARHRHLFSQPIRIHSGRWPLRGHVLEWRARTLAWALSTRLCGQIGRWPTIQRDLRRGWERQPRRLLRLVATPWTKLRRLWTHGVTIPGIRFESPAFRSARSAAPGQRVVLARSAIVRTQLQISALRVMPRLALRSVQRWQRRQRGHYKQLRKRQRRWQRYASRNQARRLRLLRRVPFEWRQLLGKRSARARARLTKASAGVVKLLRIQAKRRRRSLHLGRRVVAKRIDRLRRRLRAEP